MNTIAIIDMAASFATLAAIIILCIKMWRSRSVGHKGFLVLILLLASMLYYSSLTLEWLWSQQIFAETEDFVGVLLPVFWGFAFYGIQQEKRKNELKQSELLHRQFIENQPVGLCRTTIGDGGRFIVANTALARMLGYASAKQLLGSTSSEFYKHPEDRNRVIDNLIEHDRVDGIEFEGKKRDGTDIFVSMTMRLIRDKDGNPIEIEGTIEDITARKKAELALQKRERLHRQAQRIAKLGHWEVSLDKSFPIWSEEMYRINEFDKEKYDGSFEKILERVHPEDRQSVESMASDAIENGVEINNVHRLLFPDKRIKYVHAIGQVEYDENGDPLRIIGTAQDVT